MESRMIAAIGTACWLGAAASFALAAPHGAKADAKSAAKDAAAKEADGASHAKAKGVKAAGPRLRMAEHHGKNPDMDRDLRYCLDLPTAKEVIRCTEKKE